MKSEGRPVFKNAIRARYAGSAESRNGPSGRSTPPGRFEEADQREKIPLRENARRLAFATFVAGAFAAQLTDFFAELTGQLALGGDLIAMGFAKLTQSGADFLFGGIAE